MTSADAPPDRFLVGLATLSLVADAAEHRPVACFIDDGQWLDRASGQVLSFVARRLLAEPIALICATRTGQDDDVLAGLPELAVHGLTDRDAEHCCRAASTGRWTPRHRPDRHREPRQPPCPPRTPPDLAGRATSPEGTDSPTPTRPPTRSSGATAAASRLLPTETQLIALTAAAEPLGDPVLLSRAASMLGVDLAMTYPAVDAGLLEVGDRVSFAHPLARSATYHQGHHRPAVTGCTGLWPQQRMQRLIRTGVPGTWPAPL